MWQTEGSSTSLMSAIRDMFLRPGNTPLTDYQACRGGRGAAQTPTRPSPGPLARAPAARRIAAGCGVYEYGNARGS